MIDLADLHDFEETFGSPGRALSRLIRPTIAAKQGRTLVWGDWAAIEARVLPWLANTRGANKVLDIIRAADKDPDKPDLYCMEAAHLEGMTPEEFWKLYKSKDRKAKAARQLGKVEVLSLGFGGAVGALQSMAVGYGISLTEAEARIIVDKWRANNKWARAFWDALWEAFLSAMDNPNTPFEVGRVVYLYDPDYMGGSMFCFLPDGRPLVYPKLRWVKREREDREGNVTKRTELTYRRGYDRRSLWYGVLAENITQATAGSLLRHTLNVLQPAPALKYGPALPIGGMLPDAALLVGHTHDEIIAECNDTSEDIAETSTQIEICMTTNPAWAEDLPLAAEMSNSWYYTKVVD